MRPRVIGVQQGLQALKTCRFSGRWELACARPQGGVAWGKYHDNIHTTGWLLPQMGSVQGQRA